MINLKDMEDIIMRMVNIILANGIIILNMEKENYIIKMVKLNLMVISLMIKEKDMENIFGKMENIIKEIFKITLNREKEKNIIKMEVLNMMVIKVNLKDMEDIIIQMENIILVNGLKV